MEGIIGYLFGLAIGIIGLVVAVYIITEDGGGCFAFGVAIICAIITALNATIIMTHAKKYQPHKQPKSRPQSQP